MIDLLTFCLQSPDSSDVKEKKKIVTEIGKDLFADGGVEHVGIHRGHREQPDEAVLDGLRATRILPDHH
ncbi:hypothetical protein HYZ41_04120, partial [archaeon]|nr:hypothetical protein [archaeon]